MENRVQQDGTLEVETDIQLREFARNNGNGDARNDKEEIRRRKASLRR
jgi:hypothetical protein